MSKIKHIFRGRKWLRNLVTILLCLVVVGGIVGGVVAFTRNTEKIDDVLTYKSIGWTSYKIGGLDTNGNYLSTDKSIFTKKVFECQGLNVTPVFDNEVAYQIYFYDSTNKFVHTTGRLTGTFIQDSVPFVAKYARIVITPKDDNKVTIFELVKYAKQLEVKVFREQGFKNYTENLCVETYANSKVLNGVITQDANCEYSLSNYIDVSPYGESLIFRLVPNHQSLENTGIFFFDSSKNLVRGSTIGAEATLCFEASTGTKYYSINLDGDDMTSVYYIITSFKPDTPVGVFCR